MNEMTDKNLLALASVAHGRLIYIYSIDGWIHEDLTGNRRIGWNPLTDDGDAFKLAVKLKIKLWFGGGTLNAGGMTASIEEVYGQDSYAATRRAIVRAAAMMA